MVWAEVYSLSKFRIGCIPNLGLLHSLEPLEKFLVVGGGWWVVVVVVVVVVLNQVPCYPNLG